MDAALSIAVGIGLAAACGFRVFVPLLVLNLAAVSGYVNLPAGFAWMTTPYATMAFATATFLEIMAYYIPWLDNALDTLATPAAMIAGTVTSAALITDIDPFVKWSLALIAGGGIAGLVQVSTVMLRGKSSLFTGGIANWLVSTLELFFAFVLAMLSLLAPILALILVLGLVIWNLRRIASRLRRKDAKHHDGGP